jgi:hypothetical protein
VSVAARDAGLATALPRTGGAWLRVGEAFGRRTGFLAGFRSRGAQTIACAPCHWGPGLFAVEALRRSVTAAPWLAPRARPASPEVDGGC